MDGIDLPRNECTKQVASIKGSFFNECQQRRLADGLMIQGKRAEAHFARATLALLFRAADVISCRDDIDHTCCDKKRSREKDTFTSFSV